MTKYSFVAEVTFNRLHKRCLRIIYNDKQSSFTEVIENDSSVSLHERNVQILPTEMNPTITFIISNNFSPPHMNEFFEVRNEHSYNLRKSHFSWPLVKSVNHGTESLS